MARWNSFFKISPLIAFWLFLPWAEAVNLHALYTAACQREVGIILDVSPRQVKLLNLRGEIVNVERFEIIYFATYPLDIVPMASVKNPAAVPLVEIKTSVEGKLQTLVRGWPVDFSQDKISFLSLRGSELVIERSSIWQVEHDKELSAVEFTTRPRNAYEFIHPYAFENCPVQRSSGDRPLKIAPQQLLSDPVAIKRELDRLALGHEGVRQYERDQQFFPVPEVYTNETSLGLWVTSESRYGASGSRNNNFTPLLANDFSSGPFGFQSRFLTGSGPMLFSIHEEAQTQTYYRMKADYFHFSAMVDPNLLLVGKRYKWSSQDLDSDDIRANDTAFVEFGFDYGKFALELGLGGATNMGVRAGSLFKNETLSAPRFGLRYQRALWTAEFFAGVGSKNDAEIAILRANLEVMRGKRQRYVFSILKRDLKFDGEVDGPSSRQRLNVSSSALTAAAYSYFRFKTRYWWGLSASVESNDMETNGGNGKKRIYPKAATYLSLSF